MKPIPALQLHAEFQVFFFWSQTPSLSHLAQAVGRGKPERRRSMVAAAAPHGHIASPSSSGGEEPYRLAIPANLPCADPTAVRVRECTDIRLAACDADDVGAETVTPTLHPTPGAFLFFSSSLWVVNDVCVCLCWTAVTRHARRCKLLHASRQPAAIAHVHARTSRAISGFFSSTARPTRTACSEM